LILLVASGVSAQDVSFEPAVNYPTGLAPVCVAVGDFNGDGVQDLAVGNFNSLDVSVLLGNGDGTFQAAGKIPLGFIPLALAVGDFNSDGVQDLAVADHGHHGARSYVSILLGNGDGSFQAARYFPLPGDPQSVAVGDFNNDGVPDLAVANYFEGPYYIDDYVSVLLGNGDGTFRDARCCLLGTDGFTFSSSSVAVGDFNNDGMPDLAVAIDVVGVLLGNGDGTFQGARNFFVDGSPVSVAVGDFNGDGVQDLAVAGDSRGVAVLLGNGDGTFQAARYFAAGRVPWSVAVGDFNGDGVQDLVVANDGTYPLYQDSSVSVLLGNGDGTFQAAQNFDVGLAPRSVAVADFNGDGLPDLAVANVASNDVSVLINNTPIANQRSKGKR
jgi:hypothetical protein